MGRQATLNEILDSRERRAARQKELLSLYGTPLVSFTMNIPGAEKDSFSVRAGFAEGLRRLLAALSAARSFGNGVSADTNRIESPTFKYEEERYPVTGPEAFLCVDMDPRELKRIAVGLEEADPLGRLFDMDVISPGGIAVSRSELGLPPRKCLLCGDSAKMCRRAGRHTTDELSTAAEEILKKSLSDCGIRASDRSGICETLADLACAALRAELDATPKPGLVDRCNSGSHTDMNYSTFCRSIEALRPYFADAARLGADTAGWSAYDFGKDCRSRLTEVFERLRELGKTAEQHMFAATGGVNTHKGAIFSMGLAVCAAARLLFLPAGNSRLSGDPFRKSAVWNDSRSDTGSGERAGASERGGAYSLPEAVLDECARLTEGLCARDFAGVTLENAETAGEKLYARYGVTGARGQAEAGFPAVRLAGLPVFRQVLETDTADRPAMRNAAACTALLAILCHTPDTNLIKRGGREKAEEIIGRIRRMLEEKGGAGPSGMSFGSSTVPGTVRIPTERELLLLDRDFIREGLSPGGSADLLALTVFLYDLDRNFGKNEV